jgi:AcrR family transcriptional regulator
VGGRKEVVMNHKVDRQSEIYAKALNLFMQKGYNGASMSMIAKALGMSKPNLYHYCSSKEDLFYKIHLDYLRKHLIPFIDEAERLPDPKARIAHVLRRLTILNTTDKACRVLIPDIINLKRSHHQAIVSIWKRAYELVRNSITELQKSGSILEARESFLAFLGFSMANGTVYWFDYGRQAHAEELAETLVQVFLGGLFSPAKKKG